MNRLKLSGSLCFKLLTILIVLSPLSACKKSNTKFYDIVLSDFDTNSYFVAVNIRSTGYRGRVIIENNNLYLFLNKTKGFTKEEYKSKMKKILVHNRSLNISGQDFITWKFIKVYELGSVIQAANLGENQFIAYFFNGKFINYGIPEKEQNAIINQLFFWNVPSKIDKITGVLIIG